MFKTKQIFTYVTTAARVFSCAMLTQVFFFSNAFAQTDSNRIVLKKVVVAKEKKPNLFKNPIPAQRLNNQTLQQINTQSVGDAARYFSGVLIKDYGGIGGLKTISVRSLGATNTAILYDGIPVSDIQSGQIDLSRFSSTFVQSLELYQANPTYLLAPARAYASPSALAITTNAFNTHNFSNTNWQAGLKAGSFGLWQPFAGIYLPAGNNAAVSANVESVFSKGNYPFYIENGNLSQHAKRNNSAVKSFQGEINFVKQFSDSSQWQTKVWGYTSKRGLPGAIILYNDRSVQKLWNEDVFAQSRYRKALGVSTALLVSAKYSHTYTRYTDPDFLNNQGGLDSRYNQQELYGSVALSQRLAKNFLLSAASDMASTDLKANTNNFAFPSRLSLWNNLSARYINKLLQVDGSLLYTTISDKTKTGNAAANKNKLTPTIAASIKPNIQSPFLFRAFYKNIFRMPTFNDLYYNFIGNSKLRPEYSKQYNAGITYSKSYAEKNLNQLSISIDGYFNKIKDKIIAVPSTNLFVWTMLNLGEVEIKGIDVTAEASGKFSENLGWSARGAYTFQHAVDITDPTSSSYKNRIPYTPDHSGSAIAILYYKDWSAGYSFLFSGTRYTLGENSYYTQLAGWATHDFSVSRLLKTNHFKATIKGELNNITNARFDVVKNYPMPGRSFKIGITFNNL